jgi:hypothetical protein
MAVRQEVIMHQFISTTLLIAAFGAGALSPSSAAPSEAQAINDAITCRSIEAPSERLACLDSAATALAAAQDIKKEEIAGEERQGHKFLGLIRRKAAPTEESLPVAEAPEEFGGESLPATRKEKQKKKRQQITASITEYSVNRYGKITVTLGNGQVWRQLNSDGSRLILSAKGRVYTARIKRGLAGGYMMKIHELNRTIRVRRIK